MSNGRHTLCCNFAFMPKGLQHTGIVNSRREINLTIAILILVRRVEGEREALPLWRRECNFVLSLSSLSLSLLSLSGP